MPGQASEEKDCRGAADTDNGAYPASTVPGGVKPGSRHLKCVLVRGDGTVSWGQFQPCDSLAIPPIHVSILFDQISAGWLAGDKGCEYLFGLPCVLPPAMSAATVPDHMCWRPAYVSECCDMVGSSLSLRVGRPKVRLYQCA